MSDNNDKKNRNQKKLRIMVQSNGEWKSMNTIGYILHLGPILLSYVVFLFYLSWISITGVQVMMPLWVGVILSFILISASNMLLYFLYLLLIKPEKLIQNENENLEEK